eukprot:5121380-Pyramimonas_sp.AAC.1
MKEGRSRASDRRGLACDRRRHGWCVDHGCKRMEASEWKSRERGHPAVEGRGSLRAGCRDGGTEGLGGCAHLMGAAGSIGNL